MAKKSAGFILNPAMRQRLNFNLCRIDLSSVTSYLNETMNKEKISEYQLKLEKERKILAEEIKRNEKPVDFGTDVDHFEEESDAAEEVGNQLAIAQDLKNRLDDIDSALAKIQSGKYGICEKCGGPIEEEVLDIDPESRFCKKCKLAQ
jgi:DnaK suppressor protein